MIPDTEINRQLEARWYALLTQARHEKAVRDRLIGQGVETLLPIVRQVNQWKDRKRQVDVPLFSNYCFAQFRWHERLTVLNVQGVFRIVGSGTRPEAIPQAEMDAIKTLMTSDVPCEAHAYIKEGTPVEVIRGPLLGVRGILLRRTKVHRLVITINLIQQAASVEIDADDVMPIPRVGTREPQCALTAS